MGEASSALQVCGMTKPFDGGMQPWADSEPGRGDPSCRCPFCEMGAP